MHRFIGGTTIQTAYKNIHSTLRYAIPIFDYAREATHTRQESWATFHQIHKDIRWLNDTSSLWGYAIKLSSIQHFNPQVSLPYLQTNIDGKLFLDAENHASKYMEHSYYTPLLQKQSAMSKALPIQVFKTYQMYRKDSFEELVHDIDTYKKLGVKLVRGAYITQDKQNNVLWDTIEETHKNYDKAIDYLCNKIADNPSSNQLAVVFATHNSNSIHKVLQYAKNIPSIKTSIATAQLLGMRDDLTHEAIENNILAYKYVPYGSFHEMYPYLMRRFIENYKICKHIFSSINKK